MLSDLSNQMWMDMDGHNMIKPKWSNLYVCKVHVHMNYYDYIYISSCNQSSVIWVEHAHMYTYTHTHIYIYMYGIWQFGTYQKQVARDLDSYPNLVSFTGGERS